MTNEKLQAGFAARKKKHDEAADYISSAEVEAAQKPAYKSNGKEAVSARTMCISLSVRQQEAIDKISVVQRKSKAAIVREAIDMYLKRHQADIDKYDAFFGSE